MPAQQSTLFTSFDASWREWINLNISRRCDPTEMHGILVQHGFETTAAQQQIIEATQRLQDQAAAPSPAGAETHKPQAQQAQPTQRLQIPQPAAHSAGLMIPTAVALDTTDADVYTVDNFLSASECMQLITCIRSNLRKSTTTNDEGVYADFRTSSTCDLGLLNNAFIDEIDRRICRLLGIAAQDSETLQGQWYEIGQEFKAHTDYFEPGTKEYQEHAAEAGQRTWTVMIYLNTVQAGGNTEFPVLGCAFQPVAGNAVIWNSLTKRGDPNPATLHHAQPVEHGYKAIITKWFRSKQTPIAYHKEANEYLPPLTRTGFVKQQMPDALFKLLRNYYRQQCKTAADEAVPDFITGRDDNTSAPSQLIELDQAHKQKVHALLLPIIEAWVGSYVEPTFVYGIRNYLRGSSLKVHRDRPETHIASAILNIDQQHINEDWPLYIEDHHYRSHQLILKPGEMVLYEGARLRHGRPTPLDGEGFANVFVHYKLR